MTLLLSEILCKFRYAMFFLRDWSLEAKLGVNDQGYDKCIRDFGKNHFGKPIFLYMDHVVGWFFDY
jgi:hypothetical protein